MSNLKRTEQIVDRLREISPEALQLAFELADLLHAPPVPIGKERKTAKVGRRPRGRPGKRDFSYFQLADEFDAFKVKHNDLSPRVLEAKFLRDRRELLKTLEIAVNEKSLRNALSRGRKRKNSRKTSWRIIPSRSLGGSRRMLVSDPAKAALLMAGLPLMSYLQRLPAFKIE